MTKHSPGPWRTANAKMWHTQAADGGPVCMVDYALRDRAEADANASLIAAAPDLLAACKAVESANPGAFKCIREAIAKSNHA